MKYIVFDSSTKALTVALAEGEAPDFVIKASTTSLGKRQHGQTLAPAIQTILEQVDWKMSEIDEIIVGVGPGSYTGLRIGVTFAKVWANSAKLPLHSVSSLALMAASATPQVDFVIPVIDARRHTAYTGLYRFDGKVLKAVEPDQHMQFDVWLAKVKQHIGVNSSVVLVGVDIDEFVEMAHRQLPTTKISVLDKWDGYPQAVNAFGKVEWHRVSDPALLVPNYAHKTLAEQEWAERHGQEDVDAEELIDFK